MGKKVVLLPLGKIEGKKIPNTSSPLFTLTHDKDVLVDKPNLLAFIVKQDNFDSLTTTIPTEVSTLLAEFPKLCQNPTSLPLLRNIQHKIDLAPGSSLPNMPHNRMNPQEYKILHDQIQELLDKVHIQPSTNLCAVPILLAPKKDGNIAPKKGWLLAYLC